MPTLVTQLNKGFTLLEILVVLFVISIASSSFYLLYRDTVQFDSLEVKIEQYSELSMYTGNIYGITQKGIYLNYENEWILAEKFDSSYVSSYTTNGISQTIDEGEIYLFVYPGQELSATAFELSNGETIEL
jgi:prepilin-type N-terminal cleavage/methylation domain-containing protein